MDRIAFLFPGSGTHQAGMARKLHDRFAVARTVIAEAGDVLGTDMKALCFSGDQRLQDLSWAQPAIFMTSYAAAAVLRQELGIEPVAVAGLSLGEYAALCCAGCFSFADGLALVKLRGTFMQRYASPQPAATATLVVSTPRLAEVMERLGETGWASVRVSVYTGPNQVSIAGTKADVDHIGAGLRDASVAVIPSTDPVPYHTPYLAAIVPEFKEALAQMRFLPPGISVQCNTTGMPYRSSDSIADLLARHLVSPACWESNVDFMLQSGITHFVDVGPQSVLKNVMKRNYAGAPVFALASETDYSDLQARFDVAAASAGLVSRCICVAVAGENFNEDANEYARVVVPAFRALLRVKEAGKDLGFDAGHAEKSISLLKQILVSKRQPEAQVSHLLHPLTQQLSALTRRQPAP
jgi:[acyl-carrier-protein] S-malonyltransferase